MFDVSSISRRYFEVKIGEKNILVEPPKLKQMREILRLNKANSEDVIDDLTVAIAQLLSKNKAGEKITVEFVENNLNFDELQELLSQYFQWMGNARKTDPN